VDARSYPEGESQGHITGYLGEVTVAMIEAYPEREYLSGELVGRAGLEQSQDDHLRGRPGYRFYVDVDGNRTLLSEKPVLDGEDVAITIDGRMQQLAYDVLGERSGAIVVLDAVTGAILTLASTPGYDPNEFVGGISTQRWEELSTDERLPMFNRALQGLYPPGSVFKVVTVAAALDQGLYEADSSFVDTGELMVQGNIVRNYQRQVFGEHNLHRAVVDSINTTIAQVGLDLGAAGLEEYFNNLGLHQSYYLGLPMVGGQIGTPNRSRVALAWSAIGQDQVLLTPLHMAQIFSVFANQGNVPSIHLLADNESSDKPALQHETVAQINTMLQDVVLEGTGTALRNIGINVYGKTGTAEMVGGEMHAWFAGHTQLPNEQRLAFSILVEEGGVGGQTAAPLMREYLTRLTQ
jgi:cell division protein FtsI/penicillin-binding protein 2